MDSSLCREFLRVSPAATSSGTPVHGFSQQYPQEVSQNYLTIFGARICLYVVTRKPDRASIEEAECRQPRKERRRHKCSRVRWKRLTEMNDLRLAQVAGLRATLDMEQIQFRM